VNIARAKFIENELMEQDPQAVARHLVLEAVQARVNSDNTTAIIVSLNSGIDTSLERNKNLGSLMDSMKANQELDDDDDFAGFDD